MGYLPDTIYRPSVLVVGKRARTGQMMSFQPATGNYTDIKTSDQRMPPVSPVFQAKVSFYDVAYPYWQFPFHVSPYIQARLPGMKRSLRQAGYVGAPLPASDYNTPQATAYAPLYGVKRYG